jgi:hypothetical protein
MKKITAEAIALIVVFVVIIIAISGWWYYKHTKLVYTESLPVGTAYNPTATTTTIYKNVYVPGATVTPTSPTGVIFHDSTYGLTIDLPSNFAGYRSYITQGGPNNLSGTEEIHFVAPNETSDAFVVNIFSKQQWNNIRTQENLAHQNINDLGEGNYIGENTTWIYSATIFSHQTDVQEPLLNAVFY